MVEQELKPCPCCETEASMLPHAMGAGIRYKVKCVNDGCGLTTNSFATEAGALAAWNTRPTEAAAEARGKAEIERLRLALCDIAGSSKDTVTIGKAQAALGHTDFTSAALNGGQHE